jgi:hypothetical protein
MFRSSRRAIVFTQLDHSRFAGALAVAWRPQLRPVLPFDSFVAGVALHDRGYGEHDADDLETVADDRWLEIQRAGYAPRGDDPVADLVVALHVRRLIGEPRDPPLEELLPHLYDAAGVGEDQAAAADGITNVCDRIAFEFCFERPAEGEVRGFAYALDGRGAVRLDPWPFAVPRLVGIVPAFAADGYPQRLEPVVVPFELTP